MLLVEHGNFEVGVEVAGVQLDHAAEKFQCFLHTVLLPGLNSLYLGQEADRFVAVFERGVLEDGVQALLS